MAQKTKRRLGMRFFSFVFVALLAYAGFLLVRQQVKIQELNHDAAAVSDDIDAVKDQNEQLERDKEQAAMDEYIEQQARDKLGWVKENELRLIEK